MDKLTYQLSIEETIQLTKSNLEKGLTEGFCH